MGGIPPPSRGIVGKNRIVVFSSHPDILLELWYILIMIRYKVYNEQHPRASLNIQHVIYERLARAGRNT